MRHWHMVIIAMEAMEGFYTQKHYRSNSQLKPVYAQAYHMSKPGRTAPHQMNQTAFIIMPGIILPVTQRAHEALVYCCSESAFTRSKA